MVETVGLCQVMWLVMLESAKDRILGVDTPVQHVPPRLVNKSFHTGHVVAHVVLRCLLLRFGP
jgi:hypothetical protein